MLKKHWLVVLFVLLLFVSFFAGTRYDKRQGEKEQTGQSGRKILYYVDPMNPAHTSDQPGLAPCGMSMEPVYADGETSNGSGPGSIPPGAVRISPEKQQLIGVRTDKVGTSSQEATLRALGRVTADQNLTYSVIAGAEGWVRDVRGGTTGSLVQKGEVMALINSYSTEFYTWQQQYLTYGSLPRPGAGQLPRGRSPRMQQPEAMPAMEAAQSDPMQAEAPPTEAQHTEGHQHGTEAPEMQHDAHQHGTMQPEGGQPEAPQPPSTRMPGSRPPMARQSGTAQGQARQALTPEEEALEFPYRQPSSRNFLVDSNVYRAKLELMNIGLTEEQLDELVRTGKYRTEIEVRSPVTGFVLSRDVSPRQKTEKGAELFRVADLSRVWVLADIFERDRPYIRPGVAARITIPNLGGSFDGKVTEVLPQFDTATRALKVRIELDNPDFTLIPDMFVDVDFLVPLPPALTVPVDAVLDSGQRKTVFVDMGNGYFEARSVSTGWRNGGRIEILQGLMPGETIVVSGNFLIDSESRMKLAAAGMRGTLMKDPTCEMEVDSDKARQDGLTSSYEGKTYYFCSKECKAAFDGQHGSPAGGEPSAEKQASKPSIPNEQSMNGFWKDPVCGMLLTGSQARALGIKSEIEGKTYYFCSDQCRKQFEGKQKRNLENAAANQGRNPAPSDGGHQHD